MNKTHLLITTSAGDFRQIGVNGEAVIGAAAAILQEVERRLSIRHRRLFAEPVENHDRSKIDWWTDAPGGVTPFDTLNDTEKEETLQEIRTLLKDVGGIAEALKKSNVADSMLVGKWLETATVSPAPTGLFKVGDQPVMTLWAHEPDAVSSGTMAAPLMAASGEAPASVEVSPISGTTPQDAHFEEVDGAQKRGWRWPFSWPWSWPWSWLPFSIPGWLRALLMALLLLLLLGLLLRACSPSLPNFSLPGWGSDAGGSKEADKPKEGAKNEPEGTSKDQEKPQSTESPSDASQVQPTVRDETKPNTGGGGNTYVVPNTESATSPLGSGSVAAPWVEETRPPNVVVTPGVSVPGGTVALPNPSQPNGNMDEETRITILSLEEERATEAELRRRIAELENLVAAKQKACANGICLPKTESEITPRTETTEPSPPIKEVRPSEPDPQASLDGTETAPTPPAQPPVQEQPRQEAAPTESTPIEPGSDQMICTPDRESWEAPEIVIIMDTSGSMAIDKSYPSSHVDPVLERAQAGDPAALNQILSMRAAPENRRIDQVQDGLTSMIQRLPSDVDIGFIDFGSCDAVVNHKFYSSGQRGELISIINATQPNEGTPLARALERGGSIIKGRTEEDKGVIILISDGYGTCGGDVCAVARNIASRKPGVTINVVSLGAKNAAQCAADLTGGRVVDVENIGLLQALSDASEEKQASGACK